jgi:hypothetical protein
MPEDIEDIKAVARRSLEESFANGDVEGFLARVHPDCVNHEAPEGATTDGMVGPCSG